MRNTQFEIGEKICLIRITSSMPYIVESEVLALTDCTILNNSISFNTTEIYKFADYKGVYANFTYVLTDTKGVHYMVFSSKDIAMNYLKNRLIPYYKEKFQDEIQKHQTAFLTSVGRLEKLEALCNSLE